MLSPQTGPKMTPDEHSNSINHVVPGSRSTLLTFIGAGFVLVVGLGTIAGYILSGLGGALAGLIPASFAGGLILYVISRDGVRAIEIAPDSVTFVTGRSRLNVPWRDIVPFRYRASFNEIGVEYHVAGSRLEDPLRGLLITSQQARAMLASSYRPHWRISEEVQKSLAVMIPDALTYSA